LLSNDFTSAITDESYPSCCEQKMMRRSSRTEPNTWTRRSSERHDSSFS